MERKCNFDYSTVGKKAHVHFFPTVVFSFLVKYVFCSDIVFHCLFNSYDLWKNKIRHAHLFWWACLFFIFGEFLVIWFINISDSLKISIVMFLTLPFLFVYIIFSKGIVSELSPLLINISYFYSGYSFNSFHTYYMLISTNI